MKQTKTVDYSRTVQHHMVLPGDLNGGGRLFGGSLLSMIDEVAGMVARRHSGNCNVTTASIEKLDFKAGAYINDILVLVGYVTYTGKTSMEVRVDTYVEDIEGMRHPINRAYLIMVAMDSNDHPTPIPALEVLTEAEKARWEIGEEHRKHYRK
jgi:acyl-CoA hydrolase